MPTKIGQVFPPDDVVGRWVFRLASLLDDLALIDSLMRDDWDKEPNNSVAFFRMIVTRLYEARPIVREMHRTVGVVRFMADEVVGVDEAVETLLDAYRRPAAETKSKVEDTYATVRHLTVHYSTDRGELARILRGARDLDVRLFNDDQEHTLSYLFPQDVMEHALWSDHTARDAELQFAHDLTQALTDLFTAVMAGYFKRMGVEENDIVWVRPGGNE